jgi:Anti-sigma-K factor rskA, C-terminal
MSGDFDDLVGGEGLDPHDEARLRRVHALLVQAGPPADLPPELEHPAAPETGQSHDVPYLFQRRRGLATVLVLAAALAGFAGGFAFGHSKAKPAAFAAVRVVAMHGADGKVGVIKVGAADAVGNWPMLVEVNGLAKQADPHAYYELWLTRDGKPVAPCGSFRVHAKTTSLRLSVPYALDKFDGWVVTKEPANDSGPGAVVLKTLRT